MRIVLTGAAGFIGSCLLRMLNDAGLSDIIIVDNISTSDKWINIKEKKYTRYCSKNNFYNEVLPGLEDIDIVIHLGACSSTTEEDFDYLYQNNVVCSQKLFDYCVEKKCRFIYASSAATYGDGASGFDDEESLQHLIQLNRYGYSKAFFDKWVENQIIVPNQCVGLKFFNVYGPNEYAKGGMASMVYHGFNQIKESGQVKLFESNKEQFADGEQLRDFIYVKDVCKVIMFMIENENVNGIFNVGTGIARSFNDLADCIFSALRFFGKIEYVPMPELLRKKYQYYTCASIKKLREAGYNEAFYSLEEGVRDFVCNYLQADYRVF